MELQLKIIGFILIALSLIHLTFPKKFNWKEEFKSVSLINKEMMYIHTFFIGLLILLNGLLCIFCASDLINTKLGKQISLGLFIFWCFRLLFQFIGYSSRLWKGKSFETIIHVLFTILWSYLTTIFLLVYVR
ncbi:MAG: hypothetical protein IPL21_02495 [Saprospirales bacterium]|jgi:hypothetical protein|nr:hypothetical protein [Saprospirales bacterium]